MSNSAASNAFALETQNAPSYVLQHQSVVGYTPSGIFGTPAAPADQNSSITFHKVPGQPVGDENLCLTLPFGSRVTQIVAEGVFPNDTQNEVYDDKFRIGYGSRNGYPIVNSPPENFNFLFNDVNGEAITNRVMKDADFVNPNSPEQGSVGYISRSPAAESNYVVLGVGSTSGGYLQNSYMVGAAIKVTISYVVIADNAISNQQLAVNQARPSVRGA